VGQGGVGIHGVDPGQNAILGAVAGLAGARPLKRVDDRAVSVEDDGDGGCGGAGGDVAGLGEEAIAGQNVAAVDVFGQAARVGQRDSCGGHGAPDSG
jgi:hypothetical protein